MTGNQLWTGVRAASMQRPTNGIENTNWSEEGFHDHTLQQVVRVSAGGTKLRIRLSNAYGTTALRLAEG